MVETIQRDRQNDLVAAVNVPDFKIDLETFISSIEFIVIKCVYVFLYISRIIV